jgi:hypothetical protein
MIPPLRRLESSGPRVLIVALLASFLHGSSAFGQKAAPSSKPGAPPPSRAGAALSSRPGAAVSRTSARVTTLEQLLDRGLKTHPDIVAAEAKVELAKAELSQTQFRITCELISLWNDWQAQQEEVALLKQVYEKGEGGLRELLQAKGKLTEIEAQFSHLLGRMSDAGSRRAAAAGEGGPKRMPEGPLGKEIASALGVPAELKLIDVPLREFADFLEDRYGITVVVDSMVEDVPVNISMKRTPLHTALQAVEDVSPGVRFVVRDYGILVTSDSSNAAASHVSVEEFWREWKAQEKPEMP